MGELTEPKSPDQLEDEKVAEGLNQALSEARTHVDGLHPNVVRQFIKDLESILPSQIGHPVSKEKQVELQAKFEALAGENIESVWVDMFGLIELKLKGGKSLICSEADIIKK